MDVVERGLLTERREEEGDALFILMVNLLLPAYLKQINPQAQLEESDFPNKTICIYTGHPLTPKESPVTELNTNLNVISEFYGSFLPFHSWIIRHYSGLRL